MAKCLGCGKELAPDDNFCSNCGLRTEKGEKGDVRTPLYRRAQWERDIDNALTEASKALEDAFITAKRSLQSVAETIGVEYDNIRTRTKASSENIIYCPWCGHKNPNDADYCINCGKDLER
jgi:rRNA maturation endonuclease Nob1